MATPSERDGADAPVVYRVEAALTSICHGATLFDQAEAVLMSICHVATSLHPIADPPEASRDGVKQSLQPDPLKMKSDDAYAGAEQALFHKLNVVMRHWALAIDHTAFDKAIHSSTVVPEDQDIRWAPALDYTLIDEAIHTFLTLMPGVLDIRWSLNSLSFRQETYLMTTLTISCKLRW